MRKGRKETMRSEYKDKERECDGGKHNKGRKETQSRK